MNIDEYIGQMTWKKIILVIAGAFLAISLLRMILFVNDFNHARENIFAAFKHQRQKMNGVKEQFDRADRETKQLADETFAHTHQIIKKGEERMQRMQDNAEEMNNE